MREHPIPQDITGYRFHIIGSMTLKQFLEVGGGIVIAVILYKSGVPDVVRWPAILFFALGGAAMAFVPFEERALDHWVITYFKVMFRPTKYFWRREPKTPNYFVYQPASRSANPDQEIDLTPARRARIKEYLTSIRKPIEGDSYDQAVQNRVGGILNQFNDTSLVLAQTPQPTSQLEKPNLEPRVRTMREKTSVDPITTPPTKTDVVEPPTLNPLLESLPAQEEPENASMSMPIKFDQVAQQVKLVDQPLIEYSPTDTERPHVQEEDVVLSQTPVVLQPAPEPAPQPTPPPTPANPPAGAVFNNNLPFPSTPTQPNKLVGMVLTAQSELVPGAVIEVKDQRGDVVRVVKTNALGQFFVTTPLPKGNYTVAVEAPNLTFPPVSLAISNTILQPLEVRSA